MPSLGGNGAFHAVTLPAGGSEVVVLPRWNIIALAQRPVALSVKDVSAIPEITPPASSRVRESCVCDVRAAQIIA